MSCFHPKKGGVSTAVVALSKKTLSRDVFSGLRESGCDAGLVAKLGFTLRLVGLPLLFLGMEVWREQQSRFTPSI